MSVNLFSLELKAVQLLLQLSCWRFGFWIQLWFHVFIFVNDHFQDVVFFFAIVLAGFVLRQYFVSQIKGSKSHKLLFLRQILQIFVKLGDRNSALEKPVGYVCLFLQRSTRWQSCSTNGRKNYQQTVACLLHYCHSCSYHNCKRL